MSPETDEPIGEPTDEPIDAEIDAIVGARIDPRGPGAAVAVVQGGAVRHARGYGLANLEWGRPIGTDTVFCIGSLTKPFTATAIMLLERDGRLRLDDPVAARLPDAPTGGRPVTIRQLLTHTSGVANFVTQPEYWERTAQFDRSPAELTTLWAALPPVFAPGARYSYSNSGYCLLGLLVEALSGTGYGDFVRGRIFAPLGMTDAHYMLHAPVIPRRASGYAATGHDWEHASRFSMTLPYAAGGLGASLGDLIRWDRALRQHRLLDAATQARMEQPLRLADGRREGYGLGWALSDFRGRRVVHHAGGVPGFSCFYGRFVDDDTSIIVLSNIAGFDAAGLARDICAGALRMPARPRTTGSATPGEVRNMVGAYSDAITTFAIARDGDGLRLRGDLEYRLVPTGPATCRAVDDEDVEVRFEDEGAAGYGRVKVVVPFYWVSAYRVDQPFTAG